MKSFGDLRSLVQQPYTPRAWQNLTHWFDQALEHGDDAHLNNVLVPYVFGNIQQWPKRPAPRRWLEQLSKGQHVSPLFLANIMDVGEREEEQGWRWRFNKGRDVSNPVDALSPDECQRLLSSELCQNVHYLQMNTQLLTTACVYNQLIDAPHWRQLRQLDTHATYNQEVGCPVESVSAIVPQLSRWTTNFEETDVVQCLGSYTELRSLRLRDHTYRFGPALQTIAQNNQFQQLEQLDFYDNDTLDIQALISHLHYFKSLKVLNIGGCELLKPTLSQLLKHPIVPQLTSLNISWNQGLDSDDCVVLANSPQLSNIQNLDLSLIGMNTDGFDAIINSPNLSSLHTLDVSLNEWSETKPWSSDLGLPNLRRLHWRRVTESANQLQQLLSGGRAKQLTSLWLSCIVTIDPPDLTPILTCPELLPNLEELHLIEFEFLSEQICKILRCICFEHLCVLDMRNNFFDGACVDVLLAQPWITQLECLDLRYNLLTQEDKKRLWQAPALSSCALYL